MEEVLKLHCTQEYDPFHLQKLNILNMAFSNSELTRIEEELTLFLEKRRPPEEIREELDLGYKIDGQSIEIHEIRPIPMMREEGTVPMQADTKMKTPVAKVSYVRTQGVWKIYWMRGDLKWHSYDPLPAVESLKEFLEEVHRDPYACFFG